MKDYYKENIIEGVKHVPIDHQRRNSRMWRNYWKMWELGWVKLDYVKSLMPEKYTSKHDYGWLEWATDTYEEKMEARKKYHAKKN